MEILIAGIIFLIAILIIYKNIKTSSKGCSSCKGCKYKCNEFDESK